MFGISNHLASFHIAVIVQRTSLSHAFICALHNLIFFNSLPERFKILDNDTLNLWVIILDNMLFLTVQLWSDLE